MPFTLHAVEELASLHGEPDWLRRRRRSAFDVFERLPMPSRIDEEWRRTDVSGLEVARFSQFERRNGAAPAEALEGVAGVVTMRGSEIEAVRFDPELARAGVILEPVSG